MKKFLVKISLFILGIALVFTPFGIFMLVGHSQPHIYSKTYYAALVDKVHYLESIKNEKKIILIGGSNVAFGFNSELLEQEFPEYKVANFGLYAMLGTKIMMDLALKYINSGDMVFIIPEINSQSTSLYFNDEATLKALEDDMSIIWSLPNDNRLSVIGSYFSFVSKKASRKEIIEPSGVYQRKNFNKWGDVSYLSPEGESKRAKNRMTLHYDPSLMVDYSYKIDNDFYNYLNEYNRKVKEKNARCFYTWCPINDLSLTSNEDDCINYYWQVRNNLNFNVVGSPLEYTFHNKYFFDSNFHLNDSGAIFRTYKFIEDFNRDINLKSVDYSDYYPSLPEYESDDIDTSVNSDNWESFTYTTVGDYLEISGTKTEDTSAELPSVAYNKMIAGIGENAFANSNLEVITIPNSIHYIKDRAFNNSNISRVYMSSIDPEKTQVSWDGGLIEGSRQDLLFFVPFEAYHLYCQNYYWGPYSSIIRGY